MFASLIQYRLNPIFKADFFRYWKEHRQHLMDLKVLEYAVLHRETPISYLSYSHWSDRKEFENHIIDPQGPTWTFQQKIEECCNDVRVLHRMDIIKDSPLYES